MNRRYSRETIGQDLKEMGYTLPNDWSDTQVGRWEDLYRIEKDGHEVRITLSKDAMTVGSYDRALKNISTIERNLQNVIDEKKSHVELARKVQAQKRTLKFVVEAFGADPDNLSGFGSTYSTHKLREINPSLNTDIRITFKIDPLKIDIEGITPDTTLEEFKEIQKIFDKLKDIELLLKL